MKRYTILSALCWCLVLSGCITEYHATEIDEVGDILVVEGIITDDETYIRLSRSVQLTGDDYFGFSADSDVNYAQVSVECDDGTRSSDTQMLGNGRYLITTGKLDLNHKYRLKIGIGELEYCSDYSYPLQTPEIDSIFWRKRGRGQPVNIHVAAHDSVNKILYYRWSYKEDWEINSEYYLEGYPYYCWDLSSSRDLLIGSAEKTVFGRLTDIITGIAPSSRKLSVLYRISIKQNAISKRAYDYFDNIKKNADQIGDIFAPTPSELRGNITCTTDPNMPVIGYVEVSSTTQNRRFISRSKDNVYEWPLSDCELISEDSLKKKYPGGIPKEYVIFREYPPPPDIPPDYIHVSCVDCRYYGTEQKPDDWPNNH